MGIIFSRWQDGIEGKTWDTLITDPPYHPSVHAGHSKGLEHIEDGYTRADLAYDPITPSEIGELCNRLQDRIKGWWVIMSDHLSAVWWAGALEAIGLYVFTPLPFVAPGSRVRIAGDGPSSWTTWLTVARPRTKDFSTWGTLPGAYILPGGLQAYDRELFVTGGKPLWLLKELIRDYSRAGDLILDPYAGGGTTLLACNILGRFGTGFEMDQNRFGIAKQRLQGGYTPEFVWSNQ